MRERERETDRERERDSEGERERERESVCQSESIYNTLINIVTDVWTMKKSY